jgi:nucleotidyltransferase substrate binding protein (TIGR01987 family)
VICETEFSELVKIVKVFKRFRRNLGNEQLVLGALSFFKKSFDWSIKNIRLILNFHEIQEYSLKSIFRQAGQINLINDPEEWFEFLNVRNLIDHTYQEEYAEKVVAIFPQFEQALDELITNLRKQQ